MSLIKHNDLSVTIDCERLDVCFDAAMELADFADFLPNLAPNWGDYAAIHRMLRGVSLRIKKLSKVMTSCIGDESETTDSLHHLLGTVGRHEE